MPRVAADRGLGERGEGAGFGVDGEGCDGALPPDMGAAVGHVEPGAVRAERREPRPQDLRSITNA